MNLAQTLMQAIRHYGASMVLTNSQTVRIHNGEHVPQHLIELVSKYKAQIVRQFHIQTVQELIESIRQDGADIELIPPNTLRLQHAERITHANIAKLKQYKAEVIEQFNKINTTPDQDHEERASICTNLQYEIVTAYFERLQQHRHNLMKNNHPSQNALVKPQNLIDQLHRKLRITPQNAQQSINAMIEQQIFSFDSHSKYYLFANADHPIMQDFQHLISAE